MLFLIVLGVLSSIVGGAFAYIGYKIEQPPVGPPHAVRRAHPDRPMLIVLGDSHAHGRVGTDWVGRLRGAEANSLVVGNAGHNGDVTWTAAQRLPACLEARPDAMVLMIGSNDVMAADLPARAAIYMRQQKLPQIPNMTWSEGQLNALLREMTRSVRHVAVCTIPPLGPEPDAPIEVAVRAWNEHVRKVASKHQVPVLDVHAALNPLNEGGHRPYVGAWSATLREISGAVAQRYLLGRSWDAIADRRGFGLTTDGIHLPDRAAPPIVGLVQEWLSTLDLQPPD